MEKQPALTVRFSDPVLLAFIDKECRALQKKPGDLVRDIVYRHYDNKGWGASLTRER